LLAAERLLSGKMSSVLNFIDELAANAVTIVTAVYKQIGNRTKNSNKLR
jgi:hypothetical protein